jgi:signal transduction histidine kinase
MRDLLIIVVAPTGRDGRLICELLGRAGMEALQLPDCTAALRAAVEGVGALVLADEVLNATNAAILSDFLSSQPSWSDLPVIVLTGSGAGPANREARRHSRESLGNVVLVERPVRPETLISTAKTAIRARKRQYEVRDHLEQEKLANDALRKSEKLAVAGRLAASIAHEINNPLEAVTNLHYLIGRATSFDEIHAYLETAQQELARVVEITKQTLRFHRENTKAAPVDVPAILDSLLKLYAGRLTSGRIVLRKEFRYSQPIVGFAGELRQLFANLISNALDAMPQGGTLALRVESASERRNGARPGLRVVVADTGGGIPQNIQGRIFEPFVSTKPETGTGLGLWVSSGIAVKHGGRLRFRSRVGSGTVFSIFLPSQPSESVIKTDSVTPAA